MTLKSRLHLPKLPDHAMKPASLSVIALFLLLSTAVFAQSLPDKIRGYKVYDAKVRLETSTDLKTKTTDDSTAFIKVGEPEIVDFGLSGVTLDVGAEIGNISQSGNVDFLTFQDFRVNGLAVEIEEYRHQFALKKDSLIKMPAPARIFIRTSSIAKAAFKELIESNKEWTVTGTTFVFGKFKKFGLSFKRVVPVKIEIKIKNPVSS